MFSAIHDDHDDGLIRPGTARCRGTGRALGEPAERLRVELEPAAAQPRGWSRRRRCAVTSGISAPPSGPSGTVAPVRGIVVLVGEARSRQLSGSRWSSTSSTVTAPSRCSAVVDDRAPPPGCRPRSSRVTSASASSGASVCQLVVQHAGDQLERRLAQQPLEVHAAEVAAGRGVRRRAADEHLRRQRRREVGVADPGQRLGDGRVGAQHTGSGVIRPPAVSDEYAQQPPHRRRPPRAPSARAAGSTRSAGSSASRSAASSGAIASRTSAARSSAEVGEELDLVGPPAAPRARRRAARRPARRRPRGGASRAAPSACWRRRRRASSRTRRAGLRCPAGR